MISYKITSYDLKGSINPQGPKGRVQDIELPEDAVPIGFDTVIKDATTKGELFDWAFYPTVKGSESWQREWLDDEHTEFVCVIDGILKRYWVITRVYCMSPKPTGVSSVHEEKRIICKRMNWKKAADCANRIDNHHIHYYCEVDSSEAQQ